jgi:hypothetical protein
MGDAKPAQAPLASAPKRPLSPAAQRALAEAAVRRAERDRAAAQGGRSGELDPVRYGDWEVKGIATDF